LASTMIDGQVLAKREENNLRLTTVLPRTIRGPKLETANLGERMRGFHKLAP